VTSQETFFWEECCSGVAPHLSDGSSAIGTVLTKSKKSSWLVTIKSTGPLEDTLLNNQPTGINDDNDWCGVCLLCSDS
jgi:hypothetical protein